ncbi:MAG: hypothetical protein U0L11_03495 [Acutalibacteraceae bacterium]|nr:hypothetical protein [Acutalibacteraceae bacterium]
MQKLFNADLLDIVPVEKGFIYACKETLPDSGEAIAFYSYNQQVDIFEKIPVLTYINLKFGDNGADLARTLKDFVTCNVVSLTSNTKAVCYPDGSFKILGTMGEIISETKIEYLDNPACSPLVYGTDLWLVVPDSNAIINYSIKHNRIEFRIGSPKEKAFCHPVDLALYDDKLYICSAYSYKIRTLSLKDYTVKDYCIFNEPVLKYFRVDGIEYAVMQSGVYSL